MEFISQTIAGLEDISIKEVEELISTKAKKLMPGRIIFNATEQKAKELAYMARSLLKIYEAYQQIEFKDKKDILSKANIGKIEDPFVVRCQREGQHEFQSMEIEQELGEMIHEQGHEVSLHEPKTTIIADITGNRCILGRDLTPKDLSKRDYRIKTNPKSINACLAYAAVRHAGWTKDKSLLDPNCKDGVIPIEAALWACNVPRGYFEKERYEEWDKKLNKQKLRITAADSLLPNVRAAEINSKLAEVKKQLNFTKVDLDWLDLKFDKESVDFIVTSMDSEGKLFKRAEQFLAKEGSITIISNRQEMNSGRFRLAERREICVHKGKCFLLTFKR